MQISNQPLVSSADAASSSVTRSDNATAASGPHVDASSAGAVSAQDYGMVPSFDLLTFNAMLSEVPPVRADVLAETARRLASGVLETPSALEQTAQAILDG